MTAKEQAKAAAAFAKRWAGKGYEKGQSQQFWMDLLVSVYGVQDIAGFIRFEDQVQLDHTSFIDGYIPSTRVMIEQKSLDKDLRKAIRQSDGSMLSPFQQAKRYVTELPVSKHPRWIITCNFAEFHVYDMEKPNGDPEIVLLKDLAKEYYRLQFLVEAKSEMEKREMELSMQAGLLVGKLYDLLHKQYQNPDSPESLRALNILCVRIVFCLYADNSGIFNRHSFGNFIKNLPAQKIRKDLIELFHVLDTPADERDQYLEDALKVFPYVNGGLFSEEKIEIPLFTEEIKQMLIDEMSVFSWRDISPTIFGAIFESTLNPETRRSGGMHYTSIENIHKVINPLFLDDLQEELSRHIALKDKKEAKKRLEAFRQKLAGLTFLDPACGSGNFLTESYMSLRRMENEALREIIAAESIQGQMLLTSDIKPIYVTIHQFYGIEINDFAVSVAKTALWIAEHKMLLETEEIMRHDLDFLPLKSYANIVEGNALRMDWASVVPREKLSFIMGNPPFVGQAMRSKEQAADMQYVFSPSNAGGKLDYVAGWFKKAADFMQDSKIQTAFVSSNSICQGESVNLLWEMLLGNGLFINFAHTTFKWTSEAKDKAAVMCVIVGFSFINNKTKRLFSAGQHKLVEHINGYLQPAPDVFIKNRSKSINKGLAKVVQGSPPADDGRLLLSAEQKLELTRRYPEISEVIRPFVGSREFINDVGFSRFCFWFVGVSPSKFQHIPELLERFEYIRNYRLSSPVDRIQKTADKPFLFTQNRQPQTDYLLIPRVSSSTRKYIPIGFLPPNVIASDSVVLVYNASLFEFGIICSNVHNSWMRMIAGRLKNDYRYAPSVYYNFPFPPATPEQRAKIEKTAQMILDARRMYPEKCLADMYGSAMYLYPELLKAHQLNDRAVMEAYGFWGRLNTESECVAELMRMYQALTEGK